MSDFIVGVVWTLLFFAWMDLLEAVAERLRNRRRRAR